MTLFGYFPLALEWDLVPHRLEHLRQLGVDRILLDLNLPAEDDRFRIAELERLIKPWRAEIANVYCGPYNGLKIRRERTLQRYCGYSDWVLVGDLDEFVRAGESIGDLIKYCEQRQYHYVDGALIDRVNDQGVLARVDKTPIGLQFPLVADITGAVLGGSRSKVPLIRPWVELPEGQHHALNGAGCPATDSFLWVAHYKWTCDVLERAMSMRQRNIGLSSAGQAWRERELGRLIAFVGDHDRLAVTDPRLRACAEEAFDSEQELQLISRPLVNARIPAFSAHQDAMEKFDGNLSLQQIAVELSDGTANSYLHRIEQLHWLITELEKLGNVDFPLWRDRR